MPVLDKNLLTQQKTTSAPNSCWSAQRSALAADALRHSGRLRLRVHGESMLPSLWPGDMVEIASCSLQDVQPGEIVLALREGRLFLHRLVATKPEGFVLRGDSMPGPDAQFPGEALLGRLAPDAQKERRNSALSRPLGLLFCHCGMARRLALKLRSRRQAQAREFHGAGTS
jgi:hypothetical protein